ncbi:MAG: hypothetical protein V2I82_01930 [Halieaceae bacterium]|jgi:hypothetical protein|nr:hypothetical protein [Halieaceae bacterium]
MTESANQSASASPLIQAIEERLDDFLRAVADGFDVPPGARLRFEGLCEAAVLAQVVDAGALDAILEEQRRAVLGASFSEALGADWREQHPFPELPLFMCRAPVVPTTSE